jgi:hypothetical protein
MDLWSLCHKGLHIIIFGDRFSIFSQMCTYFDMRKYECFILIGWKWCHYKGGNWQNSADGSAKVVGYQGWQGGGLWFVPKLRWQ